MLCVLSIKYREKQTETGMSTHRLADFLIEDSVCVLWQTFDGIKVQPLVDRGELATARLDRHKLCLSNTI